MKKYKYTRPGYTLRKTPGTVPVAIIMLGLIVGLAARAEGTQAKMGQSKVYLVNGKPGDKVEALISLARDSKTQVYECNKMALSKKATLKRDNSDD